MEKYTFRIDNKDLLYKKLIKLPTVYYRLKSSGNGYTIDSHIGTAEVESTHDLKLQKRDDEIFLWKGDSPLQSNGQDFVIEQEAIIGENRDAIISKLESGGEVKILPENIQEGSGFSIKLYISRRDPTRGVLKFINFYDENDPVLQKIKEETGGLYLTRDDCSQTICISNKDGACVSVYGDNGYYQYQYKQSDAFTAIDSLIKAGNAQQKFTLQKGKELSSDVYEANIVLNDKTMATLPKIGYHMLNDQLVMRNHVTEEKVVIPRDFHFLKVVKFDDDYKLTFCNVLGNEFFEYKKYDPQYSNVSDEYKFIGLNCAKKEYSPNLGELFSHRPSFFITEGSAEPGSPGYRLADVFELTSSKKGRKMATLINEFGCFNKNGQFKHCDYHEEIECRIYNPSDMSIEKEYTVTDTSSEFSLGDDNLILHTIPELYPSS